MPDDEVLSEDGLYWAKDVARVLFGRTLGWFYLHRKALEEQDGFPRPISKIGRPRWSGWTLIAWRDRIPEEPRTHLPSVPDRPRLEGPDYTNILILRAQQMTKNRSKRGSK